MCSRTVVSKCLPRWSACAFSFFSTIGLGTSAMGQETPAEPLTASDGAEEVRPQSKLGTLGRYPDYATVREGDFDRSITIPGTGGSFRIGGFVRVAAGFDIDNAGVTDNAIPWSLPLNDSARDESTQFGFNLKDTQVNLDFRRPTDSGLFRTFVEFDFFGESGDEVENDFGVRLRHAAVGIGGFQVGQFWTQFMDLKSTPESADLLGPYGTPILRTPGVRYYHRLSENWSFGVSVDNPGDDLTISDAALDVNDSIPNLVGFLEFEGSFGHLRVAGMGMRLDAENDEAYAGGVNLSGRIGLPFLGRDDNVTFGAQYGSGFAYYYAGFGNIGLSGVIEADGTVDPTEVLKLHLSYQHWWSDAIRSTVHASYLDYDQSEEAPEESISESIKLVANLFWSPFDDALFGVEGIYMTRENVSGDEGEGIRVLGVTQFNF